MEWIAKIEINATDDWVTQASFRFDDEDWNSLSYRFTTGLWDASIDLSEYDEGAHIITVNATDDLGVERVEFYLGLQTGLAYHSV